MSFSKLAAALIAGALILPACAANATVVDVLDAPAILSPLAPSTLVNGLALAGEQIVAVGQRGHILRSADHGLTWQQAAVPVSADLVAVSFPTATDGWAVGHDGVVLHSADGGKTWSRQLDGREIGRLLTRYYTDRMQAGTPDGNDDAWVREAEQIAAQGADAPLLDVWFRDAQHGYAVGAFNLILHTGDGGKTWEPWLHRTDNPNRLHLYAIREVQGVLYVAGEQGLLMRLDEAGEHFTAVETPYKGTWFGLVGNRDALLAFGLRGHAFRSEDGGRNWQQIDTGIADGLTAGTVCGNAIVLVSQAGNLRVSHDAGRSFSPLKAERPLPNAAVVCPAPDALVLGGPRGVRIQPLK